ncbi:toll/interleukin-1 receptor domain-containing protein [Aliiroseovarius sp. F20344]|uniref:toll/interleukin-1 receptor domain-containing protein n=1 Tax=Aliiroseovarius sp. F20344 TaxID=2926414 RepID=UPI001FF3D772|nr:toll/interleukin-1 receptor domain-containing protein [Aliiroseovarius sp. F20344]MCK0143009.1 toll/interleukin-1 receptor domain-containing protein [Aliiroseovarius sp. F20344]
MRKAKIFCSYAQDDIREYANLRTSWLGELYASIEQNLGARNTRSPYQFLRDRDGMIVGGDIIPDAVAEAINSCDLAVLFMSEAFVLSEECEREVRLLVELNKTIIVVEILKDWHEIQDSRLYDLGELLGKDKLAILFWEMDGGHPKRLAYPVPSISENRAAFDQKVHELEVAIRHHANRVLASENEKVDGRNGGASTIEALSLPEGDSAENFDLFLASPTAEEAKLTNRLKLAIEAKGFTVAHFDLTDENLVKNWSFEDLVELIRSCSHFAQIVGSTPGRPDLLNSGRPLVMAQCQGALRAGKVPHILLRPSVDPSDCDAAHREFLDNCGYQSSTVEDFEGFLVKHLEEARAKAATLLRRGDMRKHMPDGERKVIAIDFDPSDRDRFDLLADLLGQHVGIGESIMDNPDHVGMKQAVHDHDAILVVYGRQPGAQKRATAHFRQFWKLSGTNRLEVCKLAIGDAARREDPPCPRAPGVQRIDVRKGVDAKAVYAFLNSLGIGSSPTDTGA